MFYGLLKAGIEQAAEAYKTLRQDVRNYRAHRDKQKVKYLFLMEDIAEWRAGKISSEESLRRRLEFYDKVDNMTTDEFLALGKK